MSSLDAQTAGSAEKRPVNSSSALKGNCILFRERDLSGNFRQILLPVDILGESFVRHHVCFRVSLLFASFIKSVAVEGGENMEGFA